ncbi:MAG: hypothetical protein O3C21_19865, partial [Verrucomicrobia bacterium]|nr:hypothetical protein [Verrucomicrobiota bacterium]
EPQSRRAAEPQCRSAAVIDKHHDELSVGATTNISKSKAKFHLFDMRDMRAECGRLLYDPSGSAVATAAFSPGEQYSRIE